MTAAQIAPAAVHRFAMAGNARLTLQSDATGARFTYRIRKPRRAAEGDARRFVEVLTGPDNDADYTYAGMINGDRFRTTAKSRIGSGAPSFRAMAWAWPHLAAGRIPPALKVYHEGRCGRCARPLTDPASIERGLGPECAGK